ncbi:uncharacterized protein LOC111707311 [Eurytemora carolleeae]|uniref:uncharacterized protein LOC111707311 n=1 Tax=Eurytemora carolleeae TaxID=1294199 RepID=UPI000C773DB4|nr:uncharacterized protein LOC111707311 [Eurytemora carolleeae]|eukprot:XP_023336164.1 uncharacterized protein LOC111707311 [Eurytemora affinis]
MELYTPLLFLLFLCFVKGFSIPCAYALMLNKTKEAYTAVFNKIMDLGVANGLNIDPPLMIMDFERGAAMAAHDVWPNCRVRFCNFHFKQSLWSRFRDEHLQPVYTNQPIHPDGSRCNMKKIYHKILVMGDLPHQVVGVNYTLFMGDAQVQAETAAHPTFLTWLGYVNRVYMNPDPQFLCYRPVTWNVFDRNRETRTNNICEGFNSRFKGDMGIHPEFFPFVGQLKREETRALVKIRAAHAGEDPPRSKKKYIDLDRKLSTLKDTYNRNGNIPDLWRDVQEAHFFSKMG